MPLPVSFACGCLLLGMLIWPATPGYTDRDDNVEFKIEAALLFNLTRFVTWPGADGKEPNTLLICVAKHDPFVPYLDELHGQMTNHRSIDIRYLVEDADSLQSCQMVFAGKSSREALQRKLPDIASLPVLSISDVHGFAKAGGMIEITRRNNRLGFIFNMKSINKSGLRVAAPLLQMSTLINEENKP